MKKYLLYFIGYWGVFLIWPIEVGDIKTNLFYLILLPCLSFDKMLVMGASALDRKIQLLCIFAAYVSWKIKILSSKFIGKTCVNPN